MCKFLKKTTSKSSDMLYYALHQESSSDVKTNGSGEDRLKNARSESDLSEKRFSAAATVNNGQDLSSFSVLAKSRLTEKQNNKHDAKKNPNKPV